MARLLVPALAARLLGTVAPPAKATAAETANTAVLGQILTDLLRQLIQSCRSGQPVLLAEGGAAQGVCGRTDSIRALATSDARSRALS